jgi:AcrR family transcriptional regulator
MATRKNDRTKADLLAVATEVFATHGLSGARVDGIAHFQANDLLLLQG